MPRILGLLVITVLAAMAQNASKQISPEELEKLLQQMYDLFPILHKRRTQAAQVIPPMETVVFCRAADPAFSRETTS